jgi:NADPH-dependent F420 reductase
MENTAKKIAILGGTGALGGGLARRWSAAGHHIFIGSRDSAKAEEAVQNLRTVMAERNETIGNVTAMDNKAAAAAADIVVLTVPFSHQLSTLEAVKAELSGKILIDVTVPLVPPKVSVVQMPSEGSAGVRAQQFLGEAVSVISAFQNVAADHLLEGREIDCDVLVTGDKKEDRDIVIKLVEDAGMRGFHAGPIANSVAAEALTSILISINRQFKCHAGIRISGLNDNS